MHRVQNATDFFQSPCKAMSLEARRFFFINTFDSKIIFVTLHRRCETKPKITKLCKQAICFKIKLCKAMSREARRFFFLPKCF